MEGMNEKLHLKQNMDSSNPLSCSLDIVILLQCSNTWWTIYLSSKQLKDGWYANFRWNETRTYQTNSRGPPASPRKRSLSETTEMQVQCNKNRFPWLHHWRRKNDNGPCQTRWYCWLVSTDDPTSTSIFPRIWKLLLKIHTSLFQPYSPFKWTSAKEPIIRLDR